MHLLAFLLCLIADKVISVYSSKCVLEENCLAELRKFTQTDKFYVYKSNEEIIAACRSAQDAYICAKSVPKCKDPIQKARLSPILEGSVRLLKEFCGVRSKRRPCCALRQAYLDNSKCYMDVSGRLSDCNDRYRKSLEKILESTDMSGKEKARYCSLESLGDCAQRATQNHCGKKAAQVIKSYLMTAGRHQKQFIQRNNECKDLMYGLNDMSHEICQPKHFEDCRVPSIHDNRKMSSLMMFLTLCNHIYDSSFGCLNTLYKRCLFSKQGEVFHEMLQTADKRDKFTCDIEASNVRYQGFYKPIFCLAENSLKFKCNAEAKNPRNYSSLNMVEYSQQFCSATEKLENCLLESALHTCGADGAKLMGYILDFAAVNNRWKCK